MAYFNTCPLCGGNLDPGETCDCQEEKIEEKKRRENLFCTGKNGQINFHFSEEERHEKAAV